MTSSLLQKRAETEEQMSIERPAPIDRRLVAFASAVRGLLAFLILTGMTTAVVVVVEAVLIARVVAGAFLEGETLESLTGELVTVAVLIAVRALLSWLREVLANRVAAGVKSDLRRRYLRTLLDRGVHEIARLRAGEVATRTLHGLDALDAYFARYLSQIALAAAVPLAIILWVVLTDWVSALIFLLTVPLIPVFMVLIGSASEQRVAAKWQTLQSLSGRFLDMVQGLPTLRVFGNATARLPQIRRISEAYRRETMGVLRVAFLSALALELIATISTALVAVGIGLRVIEGGLLFEPALAVLILAPEVYLPLRRVAVEFHAAMEGVTAAGEILDALNDPASVVEKPGIDLAGRTITFRSVGYSYPGSEESSLHDISLEIRPGERIAVIGSTGSGKSTLAGLLLRFAEPTTGHLEIDGDPIAGSDPEIWRSQISWMSQDPYLFPGSVADNIRFGSPKAPLRDVYTAAQVAGALGFVEDLPDGFDTQLRENGKTLSAGQRRRIALARALLRPAPLLILDEPSANLDPDSRAAIRAAIAEAARTRTVITVAHDLALAKEADRIVVIAEGRTQRTGTPDEILAMNNA